MESLILQLLEDSNILIVYVMLCQTLLYYQMQLGILRFPILLIGAWTGIVPIMMKEWLNYSKNIMDPLML